MPDDRTRVISRRDILRGVGIAGAAAASVTAELAGTTLAGQSADPRPAAPAQSPAPPPAAVRPREAFEHLTAAEADLLEAVVDRLIPSDEHGPGAREARVAHYIDRALGGALASSRVSYTSGLAALEAYAVASRGRAFLQLSPGERDAVLADCEAGRARGFSSAATFFALILNHTRQGMFGDPYYGGNAGYAGWDLLGYPGVRTMVTAADQQALEAGRLEPVRRSAYDYDGFNKATAQAADHEDGRHGH